MTEVAHTGPQGKLAVLEQLHRALDDGLDGASERQRALLTYLVTEELEGRGDRLKAYAIATQVLGRPDDFDPQQDSIVRVEIGRLRQALERYYLTNGSSAPLVISIPKGQYRPVFTPHMATLPPASAPEAPPAPAPRKRRLWPVAAALAALVIAAYAGWVVSRLKAPRPPQRGPVVAVAPFDIYADREGQAFIGGGMQIELADILSEFQWLTVIPLMQDITPGRPVIDMTQPDFIVRASLRLVGEELAATALLLDGRTGRVRWTNRYSLPLRAGDVLAMQRDLVMKIGRDVGSPFGIVADIARAERATDLQRTDDAFSCQMRAFQYWRTFHSKDYAPAWRCFARLSDHDSADATSLAMRALLTLDPLNLPVTRHTAQEARADALAMAMRAHELNNFEFIPRAARYVTALCVGDIETFQYLARETVKRFPNNPIVLADVGARLLIQNLDAQEGMALINRARDIAADLTPVDTVAVALDALRRGDYQDRPRLRQIAAATDDAHVLIVELALAAARGDAGETSRIRKRLADVGFGARAQLDEALESTCWPTPLLELVKSKVTLAFDKPTAHH